MNIVYGQRFLREYAGLPSHLQRQAEKRIKLLLNNPRHPSLRARKMEGYPNVYEARVTKQCRITYTISDDTIYLRRIGMHAVLKTP